MIAVLTSCSNQGLNDLLMELETVDSYAESLTGEEIELNTAFRNKNPKFRLHEIDDETPEVLPNYSRYSVAHSR